MTTQAPSLVGKVRMDEPCFMLVELHLQSPQYKGVHRYQIITIVRDDRLVECRRDMGSALQYYNSDQLRIPGGVRDPGSGRIHIEHTVGELMEMADTVRNRPRPQLPRTDLVGLYLQELDKQRRLRR